MKKLKLTAFKLIIELKRFRFYSYHRQNENFSNAKTKHSLFDNDFTRLYRKQTESNWLKVLLNIVFTYTLYHKSSIVIKHLVIRTDNNCGFGHYWLECNDHWYTSMTNNLSNKTCSSKSKRKSSSPHQRPCLWQY